MAYTGCISDPNYVRKNSDETIGGNWKFNGKTTCGGDLVVNGSATFSKTINGTALRAMWGDLAENYISEKDEILISGTLVKFGGKAEITKTKPNDRCFFGVISSNPGVILNKKEKNGNKVALVGRVPVRVVGKVRKFKKLTTSYIHGVAKERTLLDCLLFKPVIGIALETNTNENEKMVECFVKAKM